LNKTYKITKSDALLITDIQKDFLPGGALPVTDGDQIIPVLNDYERFFEEANASIFASRDWHPRDHISFKEQGGIWPPHCVQNTKGANFSPDLRLPVDSVIISKATDPKHEAYSVFEGTDFADQLKKYGVKRLFIGGIATDYCILNTVLDARKLGYDTVVLMDATLGINVKPGDVNRAVETMLKAGSQQATVTDFPDILDNLPVTKEEPDLLEERPAERAIVKKKARMRSKGASKRVKTEHKG